MSIENLTPMLSGGRAVGEKMDEQSEAAHRLHLKRTDQGIRLTFGLTPQESHLMSLLLTMPIVTPEVIAQRLGMATEIRVAIYRLRRALKTHTINIQSKRLFGYWLTEEDKVNIKKLIKERMGDV